MLKYTESMEVDDVFHIYGVMTKLMVGLILLVL